MRYGIISDIHGNLEAFDKVLKSLSRDRIDKYVCIGDIVGYGADPKACIDLVRKLDPISVIGNHDSGCIGKTNLSYFNEHARNAVIWTRRILEPQYLAYLKTLDAVAMREKLFTVVHGTLSDPELFDYMIDSYHAASSFEKMDTPLLFVGHSHVPGVFEMRNKKLKYSYPAKTKINKGTKYIVNAGSVGQPRDGDGRACYVIFDEEKSTIEIKRVEYDIKSAQGKILKAGFSSNLAHRLEKGM